MTGRLSSRMRRITSHLSSKHWRASPSLLGIYNTKLNGTVNGHTFLRFFAKSVTACGVRFKRHCYGHAAKAATGSTLAKRYTCRRNLMSMRIYPVIRKELSSQNFADLV